MSHDSDLKLEARAHWNTAFVTCTGKHVDCHDPKQMVEMWHAGETFRLYNWGPITRDDALKLRMSGFTHIKFVWQVPGEPVQSHDMELK